MLESREGMMRFELLCYWRGVPEDDMKWEIGLVRKQAPEAFEFVVDRADVAKK